MKFEPKVEKKNDTIYMYGRHALVEALRNNPVSVEYVYMASRDDAELMALIQKNHIKIETFNPKKLPDGIDERATHQGIAARVSARGLVKAYKPFIENLKVTPATALIIFGEVHDPNNVGAVIRSAGAFGVAGVLIPEHNQAQVTGAVIKVSAGMAFSVPLISIGNVNATLKDLKDRGFWVYGLDGSATQSVTTEEFEKPSVFVLGNEHDGIREKTLEACDIPLRIPMNPRCESMNVAASAAVVLYQWSLKHPDALK